MNIVLGMLLSFLATASTDALAHGGKHETIVLPNFEQNKLKAHASLRITEVDKNYIVAFSSPQFNFTGSDSYELGSQESARVKKLLKTLNNPAQIFSTKVFQCSLSNPPQILRAKKTRTLDPKIGLKKIEVEKQKLYADEFANIAAQYKLKCKTPIRKEALKLRVFRLAPKLETLMVSLVTKNEGNKTYTLTRPKPKKVRTVKKKKGQSPIEEQNLKK